MWSSWTTCSTRKPRRHPCAGEVTDGRAHQIRGQYPSARRSRRRRRQDAPFAERHRAPQRPPQPGGEEAGVLRGHAGHANRPASGDILRRGLNPSWRQGVRALYFGRGHTNGDAIIYFPELRTVHGDLFLVQRGEDDKALRRSRSALPIPIFVDYAQGGSFLDWSKTLDGMLRLDFDTVIPGHGPVSTRADVVKFRADLETMRNRLAGLVKQGTSRDALVKTLEGDYGWRATGCPPSPPARLPAVSTGRRAHRGVEALTPPRFTTYRSRRPTCHRWCLDNCRCSRY